MSREISSAALRVFRLYPRPAVLTEVEGEKNPQTTEEADSWLTALVELGGIVQLLALFVVGEKRNGKVLFRIALLQVYSSGTAI